LAPIAAGLTIGLSELICHKLPWQLTDQKTPLCDVVKLAFTALAGLGAAIAYRRQRDLEANR
jgi:hypothetical protein